ncbi:AAA family ATPase [Actinomadura sp. HBU206391]|uniref:AAA family ATPase n=1 Tax=Actinomadura sp. HBU206391 TaxID=2731692 RepID=UPI0016502021|nr:AAA family ATPase [Actinomadura sp. HBU206391]MBC6457954.1 AAA family ATPase [Actinomadura sp. HBU206391]
MVWGPGYVGAPPQSPPMAQDPFTAAERDTHAMVTAGWWSSAPPQQRQHSIAGRVLVLPDGTSWLFGAWARWYRWHPSDGQWYLCPPPQATATRMSARPAQAGQVPGLPAHVVPAGPDFSFDAPTPLPFVGHDLSAELTARIRATVESAAQLPAAEYPHWWKLFSSSAPSTVALAWGVMLWCAAAPAFDSRLDEQMLGLWSPYRAKPLPTVDGPRWLTPPPLEALVGLYSERLRADRVDAAVVVLRTMWAIASALREDVRFRARADALLAILGSTLNNPTVDYGALPYGDQALVQQWLTRCPPHLAPALRMESSPGDHFRHSYYALAHAIAQVSGDSAEPAYMEPRLVAAALIAADLAVVRQDVVDKVVPWLDPEIRYTVQAVLSQNGHPLRRLWPVDAVLPDLLRGGGGDGNETLLAAMYGVDLAWCRLADGIPARPRGFPVPTAIIAQIIGVQRATSVAKEPVTPAPGIAPAASQHPGGPAQQGAAQQGAAQPGWPGGDLGGSPGQPPGGQPPGGAPWGQPWTPSPPDPNPGWQSPSGAPQAGGLFGAPDLPGAPGLPYVQPPAQGPAHDPGNASPRDSPYQAEQSPWPGQERPPVPPGAGGAPGGGPSPGWPGSDRREPGGSAGPQWPAEEPQVPAAFGMPGAARHEQQPGPHPGPQQDEAWSPPYDPGPAGGRHDRPGGAAFGAGPGGAQYEPPGMGGAPYGPGPAGARFDAGPGGAPYDPAPGNAEYEPDPGAAPYGPGPGNTPYGPGPGGAQYEPGPGAPPHESGPGGPPHDSGPGGAPYGPGPVGRAPVPPYAGPGADGGSPYGRQAEGSDPSETRIDHPVARLPAEGTARPGGAAPPRTRVYGGPEETSPDRGEPERAAPNKPPAVKPPPPGTRIMSETMIGSFDFLEDTPAPAQPVHEIEPPPGATARPVTERFGVSFMSGDENAAGLLDELQLTARALTDPESTAASAPSVLLVGSPHTGQRRLARLIALTLADAGVGDGAIRTANADDVRGATAERMETVLEPGGPALLFERFDTAILESADPAAAIGAVRRMRVDRLSGTTLIATCEPRAYKRLAQDHPELIEVFRVFRMPDLTRLDGRLTLLHVLADERRVTVGGEAMEVAGEDLARLRGPGELVNARLVETYLDQACQRHVTRAGATRDRLVLVPEDFAGVAEAIEPALRPPGDIDTFLNRLDQMLGLDEVKQTVEGLVAEARLAADRAHHGLPSGNASRHLIFQGPPGTGKTTVAGLLGGVYAALGLLDSGHIVACRPVHLAGRDAVDTENRVGAMIEQAMGGVLLIQQAHRLERSPAVVAELLRYMEERRDKFMVVCTSRSEEMASFLDANPGFRVEFGTIVEFEPLSDRELVQLFQRQAERDLYMLDEELRVELLARFERMRERDDFENARTVRAVFEQTVARQGTRLAGVNVDAATVARLTTHDLPDSTLEQMLGNLHQDPHL